MCSNINIDDEAKDSAQLMTLKDASKAAIFSVTLLYSHSIRFGGLNGGSDPRAFITSGGCYVD